LADDGDSIVRREIVAIVGQSDKAKGVNQAVGGVAGDDVHLMIDERAVDEAEVHDSGGFSEMEMIAIAPAAETVLALEEFVAHADPPFAGHGRDIGDGAKV